MKYLYRIIYTEVGPEQVPVLQLPEDLVLVSTFLVTDIQTPNEVIIGFYLSALDDVLQDRLPYQEAGGNVFRLEIHKDFTRVIDTLDRNEATNTCVIETDQLRELIEIWRGLYPLPIAA